MNKVEEMRGKIIETINLLTETQLQKVNDLLKDNVLQLHDIDNLYEESLRKQKEAPEKPV